MLGQDLDGLTVLVVGNDADRLALLADALRELGAAAVVTAGDAAAALTVLTHRTVDAVIAELEMRPVDGLGFAARVGREARPNGARLPIILIADGAFVHRLEEAGAAGVTGFLVKPFTAQSNYLRLAVGPAVSDLPPARPAQADLAGAADDGPAAWRVLA